MSDAQKPEAAGTERFEAEVKRLMGRYRWHRLAAESEATKGLRLFAGLATLDAAIAASGLDPKRSVK